MDCTAFYYTLLFRAAIHEPNANPTDIINKASWVERPDSLLGENFSSLGKKFDTP